MQNSLQRLQGRGIAKNLRTQRLAINDTIMNDTGELVGDCINSFAATFHQLVHGPIRIMNPKAHSGEHPCCR